MACDSIEKAEGIELSFRLFSFQKNLLRWYQSNKAAHPWRLLWERNRDPFPVWVSEIMLQQTVIKAVLPAYDRFLKAIPDVDTLANAQEENIRQLVRGLGYYRRFSLLQRGAKYVVEHYKHAWPGTLEEWLKVPGVGPYTAAAISSICFDQPAAVVDGNVERVLCRLFDIQQPPNDPKLKPAFRRLADKLLAKELPGDFNQAMMELGQTVCTPTNPSCSRCPVQKFCLANKLETQALAPSAKLKKNKIPTDLHIYIEQHENKVRLLKRDESSRFLKGLWGFEISHGRTKAPKKAIKLGEVKHTITHHAINASIWHIEKAPAKDKKKEPEEWVPKDHIPARLVTSLDQKAWRVFSSYSQPQL